MKTTKQKRPSARWGALLEAEVAANGWTALAVELERKFWAAEKGGAR